MLHLSVSNRPRESLGLGNVAVHEMHFRSHTPRDVLLELMGPPRDILLEMIWPPRNILPEIILPLMMLLFNRTGLERVGVVGPELVLLLGWSACSRCGTPLQKQERRWVGRGFAHGRSDA